jgi:hypothetical protein
MRSGVPGILRIVVSWYLSPTPLRLLTLSETYNSMGAAVPVPFAPLFFTSRALPHTACFGSGMTLAGLSPLACCVLDGVQVCWV